jgi:hypothetical protein
MADKTAAGTAADMAAIEAASKLLSEASLSVAAPEFKPAAVSSISVKLPDFWLSDPEMWFTQADSIFRRANIKSSLTKYDYALQKLLCDVLLTVHELALRVCTGSIEDPYEQLEEKLTASFQKSPWQRTFELLDMPELGDSRPSVLMDAMLALLLEDVPPNRLFLALFLRRLPVDMRDHLAAQDLMFPAAMAAAANRLYDTWPQGVAEASVSDQRNRSPSPAGRRQAGSRRDRDHRRQQTPGRVATVTACAFIMTALGSVLSSASRRVRGWETAKPPTDMPTNRRWRAHLPQRFSQWQYLFSRYRRRHQRIPPP